MDGERILNSLKYTTEHKFSDATVVGKDEIYFAFKVEILSIEPNPSKTPINQIKEYFNLKKYKNESYISSLTIQPIAYIIKTKAKHNYKYYINAMNKENKEYVKKYKKTILNDFKKEALEKN